MEEPKEERIMGHFGPQLYFEDLQPPVEDPQFKEIMRRFDALMLRLKKNEAA